MKRKRLRMAMVLTTVCWACLPAMAEPSVSRVTVRQRWPWSPLVDIDYVLVAEAGQTFDIAVQAYNGDTPLSIPPDSLSGDLYSVSKGTGHLVWNPMTTPYTNRGDLAAFHVKLTPTPVPLYMVVDLRLDYGEEGQVEYIYPGDARLETHGYWTNVWFGVTNDAVYTSDKLVLRRVRAGSYKAGYSVPPTIAVTISQDFYVGVFSLTVGQYNRITESSVAGTAALPRGLISYATIRGSTNDDPVVNWPVTKSYVNPTSFLGVVRAKTRFADFDLPTCAQREYFCRAGTTSYYNDGDSTSFSTNILDRLAWWDHNAGGQLRPVGLLEANHWGLYDTLGNVYEWCLNWDSGQTPLGGVDPKGPDWGDKRMLMVLNRAGNVNAYQPSRSYAMAPTNAATASASFRLIRTLR